MHRILTVAIRLFLPLAVAAYAALPSSADDASREATQATAQQMLQAGDHSRKLTVGDLERSYAVHIPKNYDAQKPAPVVLALHGAAMNGSMMAWFSGLNKKSDEAKSEDALTPEKAPTKSPEKTPADTKPNDKKTDETK